MAHRTAMQSDYPGIEPALNILAHWVQLYRAAVTRHAEAACDRACGCKLSRHEHKPSTAEGIARDR